MLKRAKEEKNSYNWEKAIKIYEQIANLFSDKKLLHELARIYKKLGYSYFQMSNTVDTPEKFEELRNKAINAYTKAMDLFRKEKDKAQELECKGEAMIIEGFFMNSVIEAENLFEEAYDILMQSSKLYAKKKFYEKELKVLSRATKIYFYTAHFSIDLNKNKLLFQKNVDILEHQLKIENIKNKYKYHKYFAEIIFIIYEIGTFNAFYEDFTENEFYLEKLQTIIPVVEELLSVVKDNDDCRIIGLTTITLGLMYSSFGFHFIEDDRTQQYYLNKGFKLIEESLNFIRKTKDKALLIFALFWFYRWALNNRKIGIIQKRIVSDINEVLKAGSIFTGIYSIWRYYANLLLSSYYLYLAYIRILKTPQRLTYVKEAIKYGKECVKLFPRITLSAWTYEILTYSYSIIVLLTKEITLQKSYAQKMMQYAKEVANLAEKYEGGFIYSSKYSSLYRAYKTLADTAQEKVKKIEMLNIAAEASKNYLPHAIESKTGILSGKIRLGLLYEEIGILTGKSEMLCSAKELLSDILRDCIEREYNSYAAATNEYIARIEDRIGNFKTSAGNYEEAKNLYLKTLEIIDYKPIKERIRNKAFYAQAWNLIETAKSFHKSENHLKAKNSYEQACEILKKLRGYSHEALYYSVWILQEKAEAYSKQENHEEAIKYFENSVNKFSDTLNEIKNIKNRKKDKLEVHKIGKLEKLCQIRKEYCLARINLERARIFEKKGDHVSASEKFSLAASKFKQVSHSFKQEQERKELEAVYNLCKAWENMVLAEKYQNPEKFLEAARLFSEASDSFLDSKMKLLASGNSAFCQALEKGSKFDESTQKEKKEHLYPQIKAMLRKAANIYRKGGFEDAAKWALATSTYFDGVWHIIKADETLNLDERGNFLKVGYEFFQSAAELFGNAGYKQKEEEILGRLDFIRKEDEIIVSALNTIKEPSISKSTIGILAPSCPIETSDSPRIREIYQLSEETNRLVQLMPPKEKYNLIYKDLIEGNSKIQKSEFRVGIAQILVCDNHDLINEFYESDISGLLHLREEKVDFINERLKTIVKRALNNQIKLLVFPEMAVDLNYTQLLNSILKLAKDNDLYIIPGSYHDRETKKNIALIIGPEGILWRQEKHIPAIIHVNGKKFKEGIKVENYPKKTIIANTVFGRIAVVICRDFLDMDLRVELKNFEPPIDLVVNPAFTPVTVDFKAAHFDARRSIYAYCFFANIAEFGDSLIYSPEKERIERLIPPKKEDLIYKDIDLFQLRSERKKWESIKKRESSFIQSTKY